MCLKSKNTKTFIDVSLKNFIFKINLIILLYLKNIKIPPKLKTKQVQVFVNVFGKKEEGI